MSLDLRLKAYAPNGASRGLLPAPDSFSAAIPLNDAASLTVTYAVNGPRSDLLGQPLELAMEVSGDDGVTWSEPDDCRFLYLRDGRDPVKTADAYQVEAPGIFWRLSKARVLDEGKASEGRRKFDGKTPGFIITTLWQEAQARGALAGLTLQGNATQDAAGVSWLPADLISRELDLGADYRQVIQDMATQGYLDFRWSGRTLKLYRPDTVLAVDRTLGQNQVQLTPLRLTEAPFRRTWEGLADFVQVVGDDAKAVGLTNAQALKPWGRWEDYITQGGVSDTGTLTAMGQRYQTTTSAERAEFTQAMGLGGDGPRPTLDFLTGDYIWSRDLSGARSRYRVRQITLQKEGNQVDGNVVLNDLFLEADIRAQRALDALLGGASSGGSTGGAPVPSGPDILQPDTVATSPVLFSQAYLDTFGQVQSQITVDWPDVSTNADGTPISDLAGYIIQTKPGKVNGAGEWREATRTETTTSLVTLSPYAPLSEWSFRVKALDTSGNQSPQWSAGNSIITSRDTTGPVAPSAPVLKSRMGVIEYRWDGLSSNASPMDPDFFYVEAHASQVANFLPVKGDKSTLIDRLDGAGYGVLPTPDYGVTWFFRFLPVDKSGNFGSASAVASMLAKLITVTDVGPASITTPALAAGVVTAEKISVGARPVSVMPNSNMEDGALTAQGVALARPASWGPWYTNGTPVTFWGWETAAPIAGARSLKLSIPSDNSSSWGSDENYPVSPGERWFVRCQFRTSRTLPSNKAIRARFATAAPPSGPRGIFDSNVSWQDATLSVAGAQGGVTYTVQGTLTVPAGHTQMALGFFWDAMGDGAWDLLVDNLDVYPAVTDANITEVSANKITTGTIQANQRVIAGNPFGARAEMNAAGFQAFASDGVTKTFEVLGANGAVFTSGSMTTNAAEGAGRVVMSAISNPYQSGQSWATIQFFSNNASWTPAMLWAVYGTGNPNFGTLSIRGPKLGSRQPAALDLRSEEQTNQTVLNISANRFQATANQYLWGDPDGAAVVFQLAYGGGPQRFDFRSPGGKGLAFAYGALGRIAMQATDEAGAFTRLDFVATDVFLNSSSAEGVLQVSPATAMSNRVGLLSASGNNGIVFGGGSPGSIRFTTLNGSNYIPILASAFQVNSDARAKSGERLVKKALDTLRSVPVYDYDTPNGSPRKASDRPEKTRKKLKFRQRGVMAQDLQAVLPDAVNDDDVDGGGLSVDLYYLLSTAVAAIQELEQRVATLEPTTR